MSIGEKSPITLTDLWRALVGANLYFRSASQQHPDHEQRDRQSNEGLFSYGMPLRTTKKMLTKQALSAKRGRPPLGLVST